MENLEKLNNYLLDEFGINAYNKWIKPLSYIGNNNDIHFFGSPDEKKTDWINNDNIITKINSYSKKNFGFTIKIVPLYDEKNFNHHEKENRKDNENYNINSGEINFITHKNNNSYIKSNLVEKFTFDNFIQRESNQFAYALSFNVSEFPGKSYNPLYIYSDVGLGKTHLLNAIGNKILKNNKNMRVKCLTSSEFMFEFTESTRKQKKNDFITKFESLDVLLIDDIQFITKWAGTKEQFFNIFNKLINMEKQIVICSDTHPDDIPDLEKRLRTRFVMGNIVDIKPYDFEGRLAILNKKIEERKNKIKYDFDFPEDVVFFIAEKVSSNIRALEGALNRLIATASLKFPDKKSIKIDIPFAKKSLEPFINLNNKKITFDSIKEFIANKYNIKKSDLISKSNKNDIAFPRQIAMYLCKKLIKCTLTEIGKNFGGKHHSTVLHSINKVEKNVENDEDFSRIVENYEEYFR